MTDVKNIHHGIFLIKETEAWGELKIANGDTYLKLTNKGENSKLNIPNLIHGSLHDLNLVTCIDCVTLNESIINCEISKSKISSWNIFPHHIFIGKYHFHPDKDRIKKIWFSISDIYQIFDDFDSFGKIYSPSEKIRNLIPEKIGDRSIPIGENPKLVYFSGRTNFLSTPLSFGNFEVQNWTASNADTYGAEIKNHMRIQLEFDKSVNLNECIKKLIELIQFFNLISGRSQSVENIEIELDSNDHADMPLSLHWSLAPQQICRNELDKPFWFDMPLDGIRRPEEFSQVIKNWFQSEDYTLARSRLSSCRERGNRFDVDRLVAAANLFDLTNSIKPAEIPHELANICKDCLTALRKLPRSDERDSSIMALSRIGAPTLMKKVLYRSQTLQNTLNLPNLDKIIRQAIKCRNYFVHGAGDSSFDYIAIEKHTIFLTETLEFVFLASELINCGWDAKSWWRSPHTGRHWLIRYKSIYAEESENLLSSIKSRNKSK